MLCHQEEAVKEDTVRVAGVIRAGEQPNMFVPNNQPEIGQWFYVDAPAMAQTMGLPQEMTYMEAVASPAAGDGQKQFPLPKESDAFLKSPVMPQDHLNYALTWYMPWLHSCYCSFLQSCEKSFRNCPLCYHDIPFLISHCK